MNFDNAYMYVAKNVLRELGKYTGYDYAKTFVGLDDQSRLAIAIQRAIEHKEAHGCKHDEPCKDENQVHEELKEGLAEMVNRLSQRVAMLEAQLNSSQGLDRLTFAIEQRIAAKARNMPPQPGQQP